MEKPYRLEVNVESSIDGVGPWSNDIERRIPSKGAFATSDDVPAPGRYVITNPRSPIAVNPSQPEMQATGYRRPSCDPTRTSSQSGAALVWQLPPSRSMASGAEASAHSSWPVFGWSSENETVTLP